MEGIAMDITAALASISATAAPIAAVGGAVFAVLVGIKLVKWVRGAL
jgi:xanthosine utilization system XapX-like protein